LRIYARVRADQRKVAGKHREFSEQFRENVRVGDASGHVQMRTLQTTEGL